MKEAASIGGLFHFANALAHCVDITVSTRRSLWKTYYTTLTVCGDNCNGANIATIIQRAVVDTDIGNDNARDREKAAGTRDLGPVSVRPRSANASAASRRSWRRHRRAEVQLDRRWRGHHRHQRHPAGY
jgi:hypothetical protein